MDGSTADIIIIPIVVVISLATWLVVVFYAVSHPQWKWQRASRPPGPEKVIPLPRSEPSFQEPDAARPGEAAAAGARGADAEYPAA